MTREGIKDTPKIVDIMLDECVFADSREKLHKRLDEICNLAIRALEQESNIDKYLKQIDHLHRYISKLETQIVMQEPCRDMEEIREVMSCDADAETKCKMISTLLTAEPHYFEKPCEDEYIKVPKEALKYRSAGMVAYNAEWLKNHFDIERAVICGEQDPSEVETIELQKAYNKGFETCRQAVLKQLKGCLTGGDTEYNYVKIHIDSILPVNPQPKIGRWMKEQTIHGWDGYSYQCSECGRSIHLDIDVENLSDYPYCHCGAKMKE